MTSFLKSVTKIRSEFDSSLFFLRSRQNVGHPSAVVLKLFDMFYPFNKDDYQIYPQYIKWCSFIKKTKETIYIGYN